jgi:N-carbamoyl-L-amino-acid hydrolase
VDFSLDSRHEDPEAIKEVVNVLENLPKEFAKCPVEIQRMWARDTVYFDNGLVETVQKNVDALGYPNRKIIAGAGHDAQYVAGMMPTVMIFVPSKEGHSHRETEHTSLEQCWKGINVLLNSVLDEDAT